jgi:hypothetical protein
MQRAGPLAAILLLAGIGAGPAIAAEADNFYRGKQIRLIIGSGTGGGYDLYARTLAQYMPRHIPGNPAIVPQNVPNAIQVVNDLAFTLPHDGTVFAGFASGMPTAPFFRPDQAKFDAAKLTWLGSANVDVQTDYVWSTVPVYGLADLRRQEVILGAVIPGDATVDFPLLANAILGFKYRLVTGYHTTAEIDLALERGEVQGNGGVAWGSLKTRHPDWIRDKKVRLLAQYGMKPHPEIPDIPLIMDQAKSDEDRQALSFMLARQEMGRPYAAPPGLPPERTALLRRAFDATMQDPDFLADAAARQLEIAPMTGEAVDALVRRITATPPATIARVKAALSVAPGKN